MPNSVTYLNRTPIFEWNVVWCGSKNWISNIHLFGRDWIVCLKCDNHSRRIGQHNWRGPI